MRFRGKFLVKNIKNLPELVIDTSTFFSANYNRNGNEAELFQLADEGKYKLILFQYVYDELKAVYRRKGIDFNFVLDLLDTYHNITFEDIDELSDEEVALAIKLITDPKDRPIFIFAYRKLISNQNAFFVAGDHVFFTEEVKNKLNFRVYHTIDFINMIKKRIK